MSGKIVLVQNSKESSPRGSKRWFHWKVSIDGDDEDLARIISVTYFLHPTFPVKEVKRSNRSEKFEFSTGGWGTFTIRLEVLWKKDDGTQANTKHEHYLDFSGKEKRTSFELA